MNISLDKSKLTTALFNVDEEFRYLLVDIYIELKKRYIKSFYSDEFDSVGISSGKFCETVFRFLEKELTGKYTPFSAHISNFPAKIEKLSQLPSESGNDSLRIIIPRVLNFIYTLRNKRGIGHTGGDIEANAIDISTIAKNTDWIICELIRLYHNLPMEQAQDIINSLNIKIIPDIWQIDGSRRIIKDGFTHKQKVLLLLYNELNNNASISDLFNWTEYSNTSLFKTRVIVPLHKEKLIEYNMNKSSATISPKGISEIEKVLIRI
ncbi:hypothetical protein [Dysgonomonas capnocytophagoides]|uniref:hypothetical protein n=1 Tax=Dysgonomonas capnocytophagoides TaxID=45254 RepID=UPI00399483F9